MDKNGKGVLEDDKEAVKWYHKAANQGYADVQYNLAQMYRRGEGVLKDDKEAVKWYHKAADQGVAKAQYSLGLMYKNGKGVLKSMTQAKYWIQKTFAGSNVEASKAAKKIWDKYELWKY
jgi:TPR repeat protein